jgi:hypothetical protein
MIASGQHKIGRYDVRTLRSAAGVKARVILGRGQFVDVEAVTLEAALEGMRAALIERDSARLKCRVGGIPTAEEYLEALFRLDARGEVAEHHTRMLRALYNAPDRTLTATELSRAAGWSSHSSANEKLGQFAKAWALEMGYTPSEEQRDGTPVWTFALAKDAGERSPTGEWCWKMRCELVDCLERWWGGAPRASS